MSRKEKIRKLRNQNKKWLTGIKIKFVTPVWSDFILKTNSFHLN